MSSRNDSRTPPPNTLSFTRKVLACHTPPSCPHILLMGSSILFKGENRRVERPINSKRPLRLPVHRERSEALSAPTLAQRAHGTCSPALSPGPTCIALIPWFPGFPCPLEGLACHWEPLGIRVLLQSLGSAPSTPVIIPLIYMWQRPQSLSDEHQEMLRKLSVQRQATRTGLSLPIFSIPPVR